MTRTFPLSQPGDDDTCGGFVRVARGSPEPILELFRPRPSRLEELVGQLWGADPETVKRLHKEIKAEGDALRARSAALRAEPCGLGSSDRLPLSQGRK